MADPPDTRQAVLSAAYCAGLPLPARPRLAPWLLATDLGDGRLQLRSAESAHTLTHPLLARVFRRIESLLDGQHTVEDVVAHAGADAQPTTVVFLLKLLQGRGLLQPGVGETALSGQAEARWERQLRLLGHFVPDAASAQGLLAKATVGLAGSPCELRELLSAALVSVGVGRLTDLPPPSEWATGAAGLDLIVACEESPAVGFFEEVNRACLSTGTRWLRVSVSGILAQLGPAVVPHQTACYTCLDLRHRAHQQDLDAFLSYRARLAGPGGHRDEGRLAPLWSALAGQAAVEVMRLLVGFTPAVTVGRFYEFSAASPVPTAHDVLRMPRCESCGRRRTFATAWDRDFMPAGDQT